MNSNKGCRSVNMNVLPDLEKIVAAAKEANISIRELQFVRDTETDMLESLSILVDGHDEAKSYFSWLLTRSNLTKESVA